MTTPGAESVVPMTLDEWDAYLGGLADADVLGLTFKEADGEELARILADKAWPYYEGRRGMYAVDGDNSNRALRHLQRKYNAALRLLAAGASDA